MLGVVKVTPVTLADPFPTVIGLLLNEIEAPGGKPVTSNPLKVTGPLNPLTGVPVMAIAAVVVPAFPATEVGDADRAKSATTKLTGMVWTMLVLEPVPVTLIE